MRVFLDTNVLISSFIARGLSSEIFRLIIKEHELVIGETVLIEFERVLFTKFNMPKAQVVELLNFLDSFEKCTLTDEKSPMELTDKDDERILANALKSKSDVLITGDKDLLSVNGKVSIKILSPREFLQLIKTK